MTAHVFSPSLPSLSRILRKATRAMYTALDNIGRARGAAAVSQVLYAMTDEDLAARGLTRDQIPERVRRILTED